MKIFARTTLAAAAVVAVGAQAGTQSPPKAESSLVGIALYDTGVDVVKRFGSPTEIEAIVIGEAGGGAGAGGAGGGGGFAPPPGGGFGGGGTAERPQVGFQAPPLSIRPQGAMGGMVPPGARSSSGGGGQMGGGAGGGGSTGVTETKLIRWIYRRGAGSSLNFVLNKFNKVVQIEAIGIANSSVKTSRGITLGSNMASVISKYNDPDGYDVGNDYFMIRFLQNYNAAFRFTREHANAPYRVTGIVVAAGKA